MPVQGAFIFPHPPILLPEVGRGEERKIAATAAACAQAAGRIAALKPDTVVITSPHSAVYADYFHISPGASASGHLGRFGAPSVRAEIAYDTEMVEAVSRLAGERGIPAGTLGEKDSSLDHATLIPLYFLQKEYSSCRYVRIGLSGLDPLAHYKLGECVAAAADRLGRNCVMLASGDLSHKLKEEGPYGFDADGPLFDEEITQAMKSGDFLRFLSFDEDFCDAAAECGRRSFIIMAGALDGKAVEPEFLSYEGPFGVGYAVCCYRVAGDDENRRFGELFERGRREKLAAVKEKESAYVRLARLTLETYVKTRRIIRLPAGLPAEMLTRRAGVFVSLKKHGRLRGCIGTIEPTKPCIADEIVENAVSAGTRDPRFDAVEEDELPELVYSVDVLSPPEPVASVDELDPKRYGVIVSCGRRRGLLLPNLEGVDTVERQVSIAMQKGGIDPKEPYTLQRFEVVRHT